MRAQKWKSILFAFLSGCLVYYWFLPEEEEGVGVDELWLAKCSNLRRTKEFERPGQCDVIGYIEKLNKYRETAKYPLPNYLLQECKHVFYNRVPKCGSQSVYEAMSVLGERYNYTVKKKAKGMGRDPSRRPHKVEPYLYSVRHLDNPLVTTKHIYFLDFVRSKILDQPMVMVNVLRDPVDQVVSIYSWRRWGDSILNETRDPDSFMDLDTCLKKFGGGAECLNWEMTALPFLCEGGHHAAKCWERAEPTEVSIQRAKWHISHTFLTVGIMEDLPAFSEVLEATLPHMFCNLTQVYEETSSASLKKYKSVKKEELSSEGLHILKQKLAYNYELYNFVKQRFYSILSKVRRHKLVSTQSL